MSWYDGMTPEKIGQAIFNGTAPGATTPGALIEVPGGHLVRYQHWAPGEMAWSQPDNSNDFRPRDRKIWCPRWLQPLAFWVLRRLSR